MEHTLNASDVELIIQALTEKAAQDRSYSEHIPDVAVSLRNGAMRCETLALILECAESIHLHNIELGNTERAICAAL